MFHADLADRGLPQRPTAIVLQRQGINGLETVDSITSPRIITDWENDEVSMLNIKYYYDGKFLDAVSLSDAQVFAAPFLALNIYSPTTSLGEKGYIEVNNPFASPTDHVHIRITNDQNGALVHEETIVGVENHVYEVSPGSYTVHYEALDGCYVGQTGEQQQSVKPAEFNIKTTTGRMMCANDGVIRVSVQPGLGDIDQVNYEITPSDGGATVNGQTTTPYVPKEFPGLEKGCYTIKATAIVLRGFDGQPHSYEVSNRECLETRYDMPLSVRNAPELSSPASNECGTGGAIGLDIRGSRKADVKVFMTDNPAGPVHPRQELIQDSNGNWGKDLAPGSYKLFVTDGCMDIVVPKRHCIANRKQSIGESRQSMHQHRCICHKFQQTAFQLRNRS